jgi:hypothetical protein
MNMYVMLMIILWDVNACLRPRGVTQPAQPRRGLQQGNTQGTGLAENPPYVIDPRYRQLTCYNCGEPSHFVGNYQRPKIVSSAVFWGHHMDACPT